MLHRHKSQTGPQTKGITLHRATLYDSLPMWQLVTRGKGDKLWEVMLDQAGVKPGDSVLDVGCGPGALTLKAQARTGQTGRVIGIDASPEMIAVAREKARKAKAQVDFRLEVVEKLPFPDRSFDVVLSSLMMHHLPDDVKRQALAEIRRVLKPGGSLMIIDFKRTEPNERHSFLSLMHHLSRSTGVQDLVPFLEEAGFEQIMLSDTLLKEFGYLRGYA